MNASRVENKSSSNRLALIGVAVVGMALCSIGIGKVAASGQWLSFPGIAGSVLGVIALAVVGARLIGNGLPFGRTDGDAIKVVIGIGLVKFAVAILFLGT